MTARVIDGRWRCGARAVAGLVVVALVAASCSGDDSPEADPGPTEADPTESPPSEPDPPANGDAAEEAWSLDVPIVGTPVVADDVVVVYAAADEQLELVGIDAATGEQLWSQEASTSIVPPGVSVHPAVLTDADGAAAPVYFRPTGEDLVATLVRADPRTGEDVWETEPTAFATYPGACGPDDPDICVSTRIPDGRNGPRRRIAIATGAVGEEPTPPNEGVRAIGRDGLTDLRVGGVEHLAVLDPGGVVRWQVPVESVFGPAWSTDFGWSWEHHADAGVFVGSVGRETPGEPPVEQDLAVSQTVALDDQTGAVVWSDDGSGVWCAGNLAIPSALAETEERPGPPIRCRATGTLAYETEEDDDPTASDVDVTIEGFDPATGEATWTVAAGEVPDLLITGGVSAVAGPSATLLVVDGEPTIVDLGDGTTTAPDDGAVVGCASERVAFEVEEAWSPGTGDPPITERFGDTVVIACDADLEPVDEPLPPAVVEGTGVEAGDVTVVAMEEDRLVAYAT